MLAIAEAKLPAKLQDFDRELLAFNCQNGAVRSVKGGKMREGGQLWDARLDPHDPADKITRISPFAWKPNAPAPLWENHFKRTMPMLGERCFLLRQLGYCLLELRSEQVFFFWQGSGGDGKSVSTNTPRDGQLRCRGRHEDVS